MQELLLASVYKNGTSLVVSLPRNLCKALHIARGDKVIVGVARGGIITLRKLTEENKMRIIRY